MNQSLDELYRWRRWETSNAQYPWDRFRNSERYKHEVVMVQKTGEWCKKFLRTGRNKSLPEVRYYTVPVKLSPGWRAAIRTLSKELGHQRTFAVSGLSALPRSEVNQYLAVFPRDIRTPLDYSLVRILEATKRTITNQDTCDSQDVVEVTEWEQLESEQVYVDIPYEKNIVKKVLADGLTPDETINQSFQHPILSAPPGERVGGVTLSSFSASSDFAQELVRSIERMVPPEFNSLNPPPSIERGRLREIIPGIQLKVSEARNSNSNIFSGLAPRNFAPIKSTLEKRTSYDGNGEHSVFSTISAPEKQSIEMQNELIHHFTATDVALPYELAHLVTSDIDLTSLNREINEDLHIQVVHARQFLPTPKNDDVVFKLGKKLRKDFEVLLADIDQDETAKELLVKNIAVEARKNGLRTGQARARAHENEIVEESYLEQERRRIIRDFEKFLEETKLESFAPEQVQKSVADKKSLIQNCLERYGEATSNEIFQDVRSSSRFNGFSQLEKFLSRLERAGEVICVNGRYRWVRHS